jgi:hypothetical protein
MKPTVLHTVERTGEGTGVLAVGVDNLMTLRGESAKVAFRA